MMASSFPGSRKIVRFVLLIVCMYFIATKLKASTWEPKDHYEALEVSETATKEDIKKAYRSLSLKYHPDKNANDEYATKRFIGIAAANEVLSDENSRREYDQKLRLERLGALKQPPPPPRSGVQWKHGWWIVWPTAERWPWLKRQQQLQREQHPQRPRPPPHSRNGTPPRNNTGKLNGVPTSFTFEVLRGILPYSVTQCLCTHSMDPWCPPPPLDVLKPYSRSKSTSVPPSVLPAISDFVSSLCELRLDDWQGILFRACDYVIWALNGCLLVCEAVVAVGLSLLNCLWWWGCDWLDRCCSYGISLGAVIEFVCIWATIVVVIEIVLPFFRTLPSTMLSACLYIAINALHTLLYIVLLSWVRDGFGAVRACTRWVARFGQGGVRLSGGGGGGSGSAADVLKQLRQRQQEEREKEAAAPACRFGSEGESDNAGGDFVRARRR